MVKVSECPIVNDNSIDISTANPPPIKSNISVFNPEAKPIEKAEETSKMTEEYAQEIVSGKCTRDKIKAFGITHYKYDDCKSTDLTDIGNGIKTHKKCANAFKEMQKAAAKDGVNIYIVSGFRSKKYQVSVFKKKFKDKNYPTFDELKARLKFSAPSGYSEHHTGLAIDINSTEQSFANTKAYKWLQQHASEYGFEISFPDNNHQKLGFEPWHWRYVGDEESKKVFEDARNKK